MDEMRRLDELLGERIRRYPRTIVGDAMIGEKGALVQFRNALQVMLAERDAAADTEVKG